MRKFDANSDSELVAACRQGDQGAFDALIDRHHGYIFGMLRNILHDEHDAEDCLQTATLKAYCAVDKLDPDKPFRPWFATVAANVAKDLFRYRHARPQVHPKEDELDPLDWPVDHPEREDDGRVIRAAVLALPRIYREGVILAYWHGYKWARIATLLGVPLGTVKRRIWTGLQMLKERLGDEKAHA